MCSIAFNWLVDEQGIDLSVEGHSYYEHIGADVAIISTLLKFLPLSQRQTPATVTKVVTGMVSEVIGIEYTGDGEVIGPVIFVSGGFANGRGTG